jgi:acyl-CoA thioester hydrolase
MRFRAKVHIRWDDLDAFNHVNNAKYLTFVQEARVEMFWTDRKKRGLGPIFDDMVVARAEVDYIKPIYDGAIEVDVDIWCSKIGRAAFDLRYEISSPQDGVYAKVKTVQVAVDMESKRSRSLRDDEKELLNEYFEGDE